MKDKILVTGGAGFIGSEFVRQGVDKGYHVVVVDKLTYAGDRKKLLSVRKKINFYKVDITHRRRLRTIIKKEKPKVIIHFAAETHVDRSIKDVNPFIQTNIIGTQTLVDLSIELKIKKFIHVSTDEIYGEGKKGRFNETAPLQPNNPYSATKAAAEMIVKAAIRTYGLPAIIVRPSNNYGPWQYPEKFIPAVITKAIKNQQVPVYGRGQHIREWLHVGDCGRGIWIILQKGKIGETYNIGSQFERKNLETAKTILRALDKPIKLIKFVKDRPGHDLRYSVSIAKLSKLGWKPKIKFTQGINQTVCWYKNNSPWQKKSLRKL